MSFRVDRPVYVKPVPPTINDDSTQGYYVGAQWLDDALNDIYYCFDATPGAAIWELLFPIDNRVISKLYRHAAQDFDDPNNADWAVNANAALTNDDLNNAIPVRRFDDTTEEGVGFEIFTPVGSTDVRIYLIWRAQSAQAGAVGVQPRLYVREFPDDAAVEAWTSVDMAPLIIGPGNTFWQTTPELFPLATLGLVAGRKAQFEFTRVPSDPDDTLVGDWTLQELVVEVVGAPGSSILVGDGLFKGIPTTVPGGGVFIANNSQFTLSVESSAGLTTINLPPGSTGKTFIIKDQDGDASTNPITLIPDGADTIDGAVFYTLNTDYGSVSIFWDGTEWSIA